MATIFYSLSGEGRGHATRVRAVVEELRKRHRVVIYAPGHAYELLLPVYEGTDVDIRPYTRTRVPLQRVSRNRADGSLIHLKQG